ncbi:hypothetical protein HQ865_24915 [Mucilaginibacter mali]|uniref:Uncharacterized protein n=1 Tax=Mucilaginibacter mali TaxID=2740462 RepID=A0A7D4UQG1_9SPHI|nr:hypothetical protein [Mucilaginibacter mali]QKJ32860.1 hypothetical protein HQ865_24915 [Mucilaginibacter mali]
MKTTIEFITAIIGLVIVLINVTRQVSPATTNIMNGKSLGIIALVVVCAIIVFGICYLIKRD